MKKPKNLLLRILAGTLAVILIIGILSITNAFVGNPLSRTIADREIKQYVQQNYAPLNLEIDKAVYNFKFNEYIATVKSRTSVDTHFQISYSDGKVQWDDYAFRVLGTSNTIDRLAAEYSALTRDLIVHELGYTQNKTRVMYDKEEYDNSDNKKLTVDMRFDRELPLKAEVMISLDSIESSSEGIAKILTDAHQVFVDNRCHFSKYSLFVEQGDFLLMVNEVTPAHIEGGKLASLLEEARTNPSVNGISVLVKGEPQ